MAHGYFSLTVCGCVIIYRLCNLASVSLCTVDSKPVENYTFTHNDSATITFKLLLTDCPVPTQPDFGLLTATPSLSRYTDDKDRCSCCYSSPSAVLRVSGLNNTSVQLVHSTNSVQCVVTLPAEVRGQCPQLETELETSSISCSMTIRRMTHNYSGLWFVKVAEKKQRFTVSVLNDGQVTVAVKLEDDQNAMKVLKIVSTALILLVLCSLWSICCHVIRRKKAHRDKTSHDEAVSSSAGHHTLYNTDLDLEETDASLVSGEDIYVMPSEVRELKRQSQATIL